MLALSKTDMLEATRLTREGRLKEALAVLRGAPAPQAGEARAADGDVIDMTPPGEAGGAWTPPAAAEGPAHERLDALQRTLRGVLDGIGPMVPLPSLEGLLHRDSTRLPPLPDGATFAEHAFAGEAGRRSYKLYVPSGYRGERLPLVVMLHGCTQSPDDFAAGTRMNEVAEDDMLLVAYPAQEQAANAQKCWNWFRPEDQGRDRGEPSLVAGITREIMRTYAVDPERVYVAGLSAGGAAAAVLGVAYPDLYAAVGVHSGLACGVAHDVPSAFAAMRTGGPSKRGRSAVPTIVFHGDRDTTVNPVNADAVIAQGETGAALRKKVDRGTAAGGIGYTRSVQTDDSGRALLEQWTLHGAGHAWSGGSPAGSFTDPRGPDASREMARFFLQHRVAGSGTLRG